MEKDLKTLPIGTIGYNNKNITAKDLQDASC
jgi:hypothetical protein